MAIIFIYNLAATPEDSQHTAKTEAQVKGDQADASKPGATEPVYDTKASVALKEYLYVKFGGNGNNGFGVSWYNSVTNIDVTGDDPKTVKITTTLPKNDQGESDANELARAIMANTLINIGTVEVSDSAGAILATKNISN